MCSFSWREIDQSLCLAFNRDEANTRAKAVPPKAFEQAGIKYLMPIDPDAGGSWICVNEAGFAFALLNNYQGQLKPQHLPVQSRGSIIKAMALCDSFAMVEQCLNKLELTQFQPFTLVLLSMKHKRLWQYDGVAHQLQVQPLPMHYFSSAHPLAERVISERLEYASQASLNTEQDLIDLHKGHWPNNKDVEAVDKTFSICMHHERGQTQSLTVITMDNCGATVKYWDGQPCQTSRCSEAYLALK